MRSTRDMDDLYRLLRNAHLQAQGVMDTVHDPLLVLDASLCVVNGSQAFFDTFKVSRFETVGQPFYELGDGQWNIAELRLLLEEVIPRSASVIDYEVRGDFPDIGQRTMLVSARRLVHPDSNNRALLLSIVDATERRRREEEKDVVVGELRHRIKNTLAVVIALARQTEAEGRTGREYRDAFLGRLDTLARANDLALEPDGPLQFAEVATAAVAPYANDHGAVELDPGPAVSLHSLQVVPVSLILHELATNALKHGALSTPNGRVRIAWKFDDGEAGSRRLRVHWQESGGPPLSVPTQRGFGSRLIQFAAERDLGGRVERTFGQESLSVEVTFPL